MLKKIFGFLVIGFLTLNYVLACNCETNLPKISREQTDQYDLIFSGYIKRIIHQPNEDYAEFVVGVPYKGLIPRDIKIGYDNATSCKMPFFPGDEWLIYAKKDSINKKWLVNYCERSRKFPGGDEMDDYTIYSGVTLNEELAFLEMSYNNGQIVGEDTLTMIQEDKKIVIDARRDDNYGTPREKIILLACSLAGMIIIYLIIKRFVR